MKTKHVKLYLETLARRMKALPSPLSVTALIFGIVPLWSLIFMHGPSEIFNHSAGWKVAVLVFTFWVGPFALALCAFTRHSYLIPLFVVECCTMVLQAMLRLSGNSPHVAYLQMALIGAMAFFAFFLLRRDAFFPLMQGSARPWRSSPRIHLGVSVTLSLPRKYRVVRAVLENVSESGMEISAPNKSLKEFMMGKQKEDQIEFSVIFEGQIWDFTADIAWSHEDEFERRTGLHIADKQAMALFLKALPIDRSRGPLIEGFVKLWESKPFRQAALSAWAVLVLGAFVVPTFSHKPEVLAAKPAPRNYVLAPAAPAPAAKPAPKSSWAGFAR